MIYFSYSTFLNLLQTDGLPNKFRIVLLNISHEHLLEPIIIPHGEKQDKTEASEDRINRYKYLIFR